MILVLLLGGYVATLVWMRRMAAGKPLPRFIGATARQQALSQGATMQDRNRRLYDA